MQIKGRRTYAASFGIILAGVSGYLTGDLDVVAAVVVILNGFGLGALRASKP
jgi:hypothetical protein